MFRCVQVCRTTIILLSTLKNHKQTEHKTCSIDYPGLQIRLMKHKPQTSNTGNDADLSKKKSAPLYLKVVELIHRCINQGTLTTGVLLKESTVSTILGISRTPVRQALIELEKERLIEKKREPRGYVVGSGNGAILKKLAPEMLQPATGSYFLHPIKEWEDSYETIENEIIRLSIISRWRINAQALAKAHHCSRNSIQEILSKLEASGLVARSYQSRWTIIPLNDIRLNNIFDVRSWLEPNLLAQSAPKIPQTILARIIEQHKQALSRFPHNTSAELNELELELHDRLLQFADNKIAIVALNATKAGLISSKHVVASQEVPLGDDEPFIEEHLAILEALRRKNGDESRLRMQAHLLKSREKVLNRLQRFRSIAMSDPETFSRSWATEISDITPKHPK